MPKNTAFFQSQDRRNEALLETSKYLGKEISSNVLPFRLDQTGSMNEETAIVLSAIEKKAATTSLKSLASLAKINELDHLGGGLELIPALLMSMLLCDNQRSKYTIEHAHASIGYYSLLSTLGYLVEEDVIEGFRRGLDIAGHVSWLPGGTELNGGRLGVMIPVAVGQALGLRSEYGDDSFVICHCGDAGWLSGQALNGFLGAHLHNAPIVFVMNRNGIQLSNTCANIVNEDPRKLISAAGVEILEVASIHDRVNYFDTLKQALQLARDGKPSLIYPVGYYNETLTAFGSRYGVDNEIASLCESNQVASDTRVWIPGSLMSWRDAKSMCECLFHVNNLPGGHGHHDGHMKGRDLEATIAHPIVSLDEQEEQAFSALSNKSCDVRVTRARPAPGSANLLLKDQYLAGVQLPSSGSVSPRAGVQLGYATVAKAFPQQFFTVSCDLDPSTKLDKAKQHIDSANQFEMGITEQVSALMADGLSMASNSPKLVVFATFSAFFEGIAREALELWRYHRNLNGINEGLNTTMHLSHVGACTGRDHFSGWSLDWINVAIGMLPYLHRFYAPSDARAAFVAVKDLAAHYGGHIIGVPRADVPILTKEGSDDPLWDEYSPWEAVTPYRTATNATKAILAFGCTAAISGDAFDTIRDVDVSIVNGLPFEAGQLDQLLDKYKDGIVTVEDGIIGNREFGMRGFAGLVQTAAYDKHVPVAHIGVSDPRVAPSHGHAEVWEHFGITAANIVKAVESL